ncbi:MAG TPA: hypothetical protein VGK20_12925 [Candidatus Binatia bacterium]
MATTSPRLGLVTYGEEFLGALDPGRPGFLSRDYRPTTNPGSPPPEADEPDMFAAC